MDGSRQRKDPTNPVGRRPIRSKNGLDGITVSSQVVVPVYEKQLERDSRWALNEGSRHFEEKSAVFDALRKITGRLSKLGVPYAVVGGMALFKHGLRRFTEGVDILVTKESLKKIHNQLAGLGYLPPRPRSKHLRDTEFGVRIEFLTTGEYPGDGKKKPVNFPEPSTVSFESEGVSYVKLPNLIELKLASGMTSPGRLRDLSDVLELIKLLNLSADYADQLNPFVRDKFLELWKQARRRYVTVWRNKWLTADAKSIDDMISSIRNASNQLEEMRKDGVTLEDQGSIGDDYAHLFTNDPEVAKKYEMVEESEFWGDDEGEDDSEDASADQGT
jgi:hypothetical protein